MTANTNDIVLHPSLTERLANAFNLVLDVMSNASVGMACAREAERLQGLSDAELARLGLTRDRIIEHAFARYMI